MRIPFRLIRLTRAWCSYKPSDSSNQSDVESSQGSSKPPSIRAPPPSPESQRASDSTSVFIPPPPSFNQSTPPGSGEPSPTFIPLQDMSMTSATASSLTQEEADEDEEEENADFEYELIQQLISSTSMDFDNVARMSLRYG
ncbi:hypothetical protein TNIN_312371 [Trichonephila inaurata madagascariensis]|uniref:Uncharacterized protein n=1 Tax=Trichonephila inaurata madagascariensis TaxID=2747483 RepID=A0A8X6WNU8_9ARAC|nr:hypothetical protein TNIN_312371 [Trichonephila inaurata madagascariensis]